MSDHADTIRDYITNTERFDGRWHRLPTEQETLTALDALLAENQRLRDALERQESALRPLDAKIDFSLHVGSIEQMAADLVYLRSLLQDAHLDAREALAGDAE